MRHERFNQAIQIAFDDGGQIVNRDFDAVIGDAVLREVVSADAFVAFAGADLGFALRGVFGGFVGDFFLEQAGAQNRQRASLVFLLRTLVGATDNKTAWFVNDLNGGIGGINALAPGTGSAAN